MKMAFSTLCLYGLGFVIGHFAFLYWSAVNADEVAPYEFAHIDGAVLDAGTHVYKVVHQGCELFIVRDNNKGTVGITTGRGCK